MIIHVCNLCGYEYKASEGCPDSGIDPNTEFEELPADWVCPLCGAGKEEFEETQVADDKDGEDY